MKNDIASALVALRPGALWTLRGDTYSGLDWQDSSQTKPTETEITNKITALDAVEAVRLLRIQRDILLKECDWVVTKALETGVAETDAWKTYRQALRDLPATASPSLDSDYRLDLTSVTWPTKPS